MVQETRSGAAVDRCAKHGLWLDHSELLTITEAERHDKGPFVLADLLRKHIYPPDNGDRVLDCPKCASKMTVTKHRGVQIDWCKEHGVWLDERELEAMLNNLRLDPLYLGGVALRLYEDRY